MPANHQWSQMLPTRTDLSVALLSAVRCSGRWFPPYAPLVVPDVGLFSRHLHSSWLVPLSNDGGEVLSKVTVRVGLARGRAICLGLPLRLGRSRTWPAAYARGQRAGLDEVARGWSGLTPATRWGGVSRATIAGLHRLLTSLLAVDRASPPCGASRNSRAELSTPKRTRIT